MTRLCLVLCATLLLCQMPAYSQPAPDRIGAALFAPELVMQHQQAIGLTDAQSAALKLAMRQAQAQFTDLQWTLQEEIEGMAALVEQSRIDENKVLTQLQDVLDAEREIKRTQIALLVKIKNLLSEAQQNQLRSLRAGADK
jgi:Spy/CpxP family protein refolding chaperone